MHGIYKTFNWYLTLTEKIILLFLATLLLWSMRLWKYQSATNPQRIRFQFFFQLLHNEEKPLTKKTRPSKKRGCPNSVHEEHCPIQEYGASFCFADCFSLGFFPDYWSLFSPSRQCKHAFALRAFECIDVDNRLRRRVNCGCIEIFAKSWNCVEKKKLSVPYER